MVQNFLGIAYPNTLCDSDVYIIVELPFVSISSFSVLMLDSWGSSTLFVVFPVSNKTAGADESRYPKMLSSSLKNLHVFLPLPVFPLWSFVCLYYFFRFLIFVRHCCHSLSYPFWQFFLAMVLYITWFRTATSSSSWILSSPQMLMRALTSLSDQEEPPEVFVATIICVLVALWWLTI